MGFALGAMQGAQQFFQTRAAQEAERLKEERLAAIRAEDRAFSVAQADRQIMAQRERDELQNAALLERDTRQAATQAERDAAQRAHAEKLAAAQIAAQRDIASMRPEPREQPVSIIVTDPETGRQRTRFVLPSQLVEQNQGYVDGLPAAAAAQIQNAELRAQEHGAAGSEARHIGSRNTRLVPMDGDFCSLEDGRVGRFKGGVCVAN